MTTDNKKIKVTQTKSSIGKKKNQVATLRALGLNRTGKSVVHQNSDSVMGMIRKVEHLVKVEEI